MSARVSALHVYPIKSCAPWTVDEAVVGPRGFEGDRRWMIVDGDGQFITARKQPRLVLIHAQAAGAALQLRAPEMPVLRLQAAPDLPRITAQVWKSTVQAQAANAEADAWISAFLGQSARFVHMDDACVRAVSAEYGRPGDEVSFADGFPLLLISQAALDGLNARLAVPVPMLRFRPSLVVAGTAPHAEDAWRQIRVGAIEFEVVKPCTRCVFTTVDFERGRFDPAGEPLKTLMGYRRTSKGVTFGQNLIPRGKGVLRVGDALEVLQ
ncbi:MAG: MOSC N-terminal beta barrel domain-containing protein [Dokdonella sp.]|uniref:MOSC domain-containing protein n=1 Tax=Dokdonella sp. TaxID=2291710 RepID=UPI0025BE9A31|nr:MOSC N-terminal beta barrel domain-containing protein [Dokdonella sp.]MBZ0222411.1 MOSC N-terminal beta barrel domain-containing protein [Dokdonella sp.]